MERLTDEHGICLNCDDITHCRMDCFYKQIYDKLKYYEDLEEQSRLIVLASKEREIERLEKMCSNCLYYIGGYEPCNRNGCHVYRRLQKLGRIKQYF